MRRTWSLSSRCTPVFFLRLVDLSAHNQRRDGPTVQGTRFENSWPDSVVVTALVDDATEVESATFLYTILPEGALTREAAEISPGDVTRIRAEFPTRDSQLWIPAGADFEWRWEFVYTSGEKFETEPQIWRYEDPRFEWESLKEGDLEVAWYDDRGVAERMLAEGLEALEEISPFLGLDEANPDQGLRLGQHRGRAPGRNGFSRSASRNR